MMKINEHRSGFSVKFIALSTVLCGALALSALAQAQAPNFPASSFGSPDAPAALPGGLALPPLPSAPGAIQPDNTQLLLSTIAQQQEKAPAATKKDAFGQPVAAPSASPLADLPPPAPESSESVAPVTNLAEAPPIPKLPDVLPSDSYVSMPPVIEVAMPEPEPLPQPKIQKKPSTKTWLTKLAPAIVPPETSFNYRREVLPPTIYRDAYAARNRHLPRAVMRQDYEQLLFASVTRNDVETARALLNAGTNINAMAVTGETPLMVARRIGAHATAELLYARGGH